MLPIVPKEGYFINRSLDIGWFFIIFRGQIVVSYSFGAESFFEDVHLRVALIKSDIFLIIFN